MTIKVKPLTVGPILGVVTDKTARIFARGEYVASSNALHPSWGMESHQLYQNAFGVARLRPVGESEFSAPQFFKLNPNQDMSGVVTLNTLKPETGYEYQIGWFESESDPQPELDLDWSEAIEQTFKSGSNDPQRSRSFVYGACRYMQRLAPGIWRYGEEGDKTFQEIVKQVEEGIETDAFLLVGDQIYADDCFGENADGDFAIDRYFSRYRMTFSQTYVRELMGRVPTYMTLDDHDITDNWPGSAGSKEWMCLYPAALQAYETYQLSHSPLFVAPEFHQEDRYNGDWANASRLWYTFQDGCCDFFATDSRTERQLGDTDDTRMMMSSAQMESLKSWLCDGSGLVKFVITSIPFFPDKLSGGGLDDDKWGGFLKQRTELLDLIAEKDLKRVVFLSGDVACGMTAELRCEEKPDFKVISVVSSGLFWPFPHKKAKNFQMEGKLATLSSRHYTLAEAGPVVSQDLFTRVTADMKGLTVEVFSSRGELCSTKVHTFE